MLTTGRLETDNNAAEHASRGVANYLFACAGSRGELATVLYGLISTAGPNGIDPQAGLRHVLSVIAEYPVSRVDELLPWNVAHLLLARAR